jgi:hypothetical protein
MKVVPYLLLYLGEFSWIFQPFCYLLWARTRNLNLFKSEKDYLVRSTRRPPISSHQARVSGVDFHAPAMPVADASCWPWERHLISPRCLKSTFSSTFFQAPLDHAVRSSLPWCRFPVGEPKLPHHSELTTAPYIATEAVSLSSRRLPPSDGVRVTVSQAPPLNYFFASPERPTSTIPSSA